MEKVLEVGVALSAERSPVRLMERILDCVMELAHCDGGTLYLLDGDALRFQVMRSRTLPPGQDMPPVPLNKENVCALALLENRTLCIDDVYHCPWHDFSGPIRYDARTGYRTQSMLVVPMRGRDGKALGVLQLINALDGAGSACPFAPEMALVLESVASQAAVALQNVRYIRQIQELFESFVRVMSAAIDRRSPYNAEHSRRMAANGERFAAFLNARAKQAGREPPFPPPRRVEFIMSIWLHDVGKVVTPLEVMDKAARLTPLMETRLRARLREIRLLARLARLEGRADDGETDGVCRALDEAERRVGELNGADFITQEQLEWLDGLRARTYADEAGRRLPWLEDEEYQMLSIRKGTLSAQERRTMEEHVTVTDELLAQIRFSPELSHVREWAAAHHEKLNGTGYPKGLAGDAIPFEVRILTILDIFDALVADDRPYKPGKSVEEAARILGFMVRDGELDAELTRLFLESRCWESPAPAAG